MRAKLIEDLRFVAFPGAVLMHRLDPLRPGQTMCGRDVDPWTAEFARCGNDLCEQCEAAFKERN